MATKSGVGEILAGRQAGWSDIKRRLEFSGRHTKKDLKIFESFYLQHKEPSWPLGGGDPIPLVYRLWFDPEHTPESWSRITEKVLAYPSRWAEESLGASRAILLEEANSSRYDGQDGAPLGFMGGIEKAVFEFFIGLYEARSEKLLTNVGSGFGYYEDLVAWLTGLRCNPYAISHYMADIWYERLSEEYMKKCKSSVAMRRALKLYLAALVNSDIDIGADQKRQAYCRAVRDILDGRPIPGLLKQWWAEAQV